MRRDGGREVPRALKESKGPNLRKECGNLRLVRGRSPAGGLMDSFSIGTEHLTSWALGTQ